MNARDLLDALLGEPPPPRRGLDILCDEPAVGVSKEDAERCPNGPDDGDF